MSSFNFSVQWDLYTLRFNCTVQRLLYTPYNLPVQLKLRSKNGRYVACITDHAFDKPGRTYLTAISNKSSNRLVMTTSSTENSIIKLDGRFSRKRQNFIKHFDLI